MYNFNRRDVQIFLFLFTTVLIDIRYINIDKRINYALQGVASLGRKAPSIETSQTPFDLILRRYLTKQNLTSTDFRQLFVTLWTETPRTIKDDAVSYLFGFRRRKKTD